ncbi:MAG: hypothetical protein KDK45_04280 [Leptospiraceae bacterium]|nr:hypothetical protein [Leptospiraceae bacterium]
MGLIQWFSKLFGIQKSYISSTPSESTNTKRSSAETEPVNPYNPELLSIIEKLVLITPDLSQALKKMIQIGNNGFTVSFDGLNDAQSEKANDEVKRFAISILKYSAGLDGLVNRIFYQVITKGAISVEVIPSMNFDKVENVIFVPVRTVHFKKINGLYYPHQSLPGQEPVLLNPDQYMYIPIQTSEELPYAIPPFISALKMIGIQSDGIDNIKHLIKKFGLLGFINAQKRIPYNEGLSPSEYRQYLKEELNQFGKSFRENFKTGVAVSYDDVTINHHPITGDNRGVSDLFQLIEQQIASGIDIDPALLGRTYSTTETYAGVVYHSFLSSLQNIRRLVKRSLEKILFLHLSLSGYPVKSLTVSFKKDRTLNPKEEAESEKIHIENVLLKMNSGLIDKDTAARELGYEKATGEASKAFEEFDVFEENECSCHEKKKSS